jgi:hypothetical protein
MENIVKYIPVALAVVGAFSAIATLTPNKTDNKIAQILLNIINALGANFGNSTNK